ncbi:PAAR domain-containing protein [Klebsiella sp. RIT-PI-d]|uniref:PAAR domain-containing protein n=1 Tax=Klebsiella sp. RIT-PI-d TaxID=1681196 RepID=UPI00092D0163
MAKGNYLVRGDKTTCGGSIAEGCEYHCLSGKVIAREGDKATCGQRTVVRYCLLWSGSIKKSPYLRTGSS